MILYLFYCLNGLFLLSSLAVFRMKSEVRRFSLSLVKALAALPLLSFEYGYFAYHFNLPMAYIVLLSEVLFSLCWFFMAYRLRRVTSPESSGSFLVSLSESLSGFLLAGGVVYLIIQQSCYDILGEIIIFPYYGIVYFAYIFMLLIVLFMAWNLEVFWRSLPKKQRWEYKFLIAGSYIVCGAYVWATSYRITYLHLVAAHFLLLAVLLFLGWSFILYAVAKYRLLNRKIFVSRKVVYSFIAPFFFASYLVMVGIISLAMRTLGWPLPFVMRWFFISLGIVVVLLFFLSSRIRRRLYFFISTHFYVNKYEYRDEWLAFSRSLQGAFTKKEIIEALAGVLSESLYTAEIMIWIGDENRGYSLVYPSNAAMKTRDMPSISNDDPLVHFIKEHGYFYLEEKHNYKGLSELVATKEGFLQDLGIQLFSPLFIREQLLGLIGLGKEFTGGRYGRDDFDLLTAMGTQAASALLAVSMAEELARYREKRALDTMSAFVLHDVKNASIMLSLVRDNAPEHINNPEFQKDMLDAIDNALKRMAKVQDRLKTLKGEKIPLWQEIDLCEFLRDLCKEMEKKLQSLKINFEYEGALVLRTDPDFLSQVLENLFLNALEAGSDQVRLKARHGNKRYAVIDVVDNGPGISEGLLPDKIFEPFKTNKPSGSGIGLWQVKILVLGLQGSIVAENLQGGGAHFVVKLPLKISNDSEKMLP